MKTCKHCSLAKPLDQFYRHSRMKDGHLNVCIPCRDAYVKEWTAKNRTRSNAIKRNWIAENWTQEDKRAANKRQWQAIKNDPVRYARFLNHISKRRAVEVRATPKWADESAIFTMYEKAQEWTKLTGEVWTVDHIIPLASKIVCGLHVETNMQLMTKPENSKKHNRRWPDMP